MTKFSNNLAYWAKSFIVITLPARSRVSARKNKKFRRTANNARKNWTIFIDVKNAMRWSIMKCGYHRNHKIISVNSRSISYCFRDKVRFLTSFTITWTTFFFWNRKKRWTRIMSKLIFLLDILCDTKSDVISSKNCDTRSKIFPHKKSKYQHGRSRSSRTLWTIIAINVLDGRRAIICLPMRFIFKRCIRISITCRSNSSRLMTRIISSKSTSKFNRPTGKTGKTDFRFNIVLPVWFNLNQDYGPIPNIFI